MDFVVDDILSWLETRINEEIVAHNAIQGAVQLEQIAQAESGFRDVVTGLRSYPALCIAETSRDCGDAYITTVRVSTCVALRGDDVDVLNRQGEAMASILEKVLRHDHTKGDLVMDSYNLQIDRGSVSGVYIIAAGEQISVENSDYGM